MTRLLDRSLRNNSIALLVVFLALVLQRQDRIDLVFERRRSGVRLDFALNSNVVDDAVVLVSQGGDEKLVPERSAVGLVVEEAGGTLRAVRDGRSDDVHGLLVGAGPLQEPAIPAQDLIAAVSREFVKTLARVHDRIVRQARVGQYEV
eukprot:CAMPEP_0197438338 /NCGR_PEP_ID=MMETSP1175-20131217/5368_1 /TAXON_ID=1003142 /ORGANISM="Triceratium dubium, Strain CCMP147" /LENGTH=147 /DNA_ID=CAMNT_0042968049 /DNA_START=127 /DNA_END=566 /DNA_ORIENTATION=-